MYIFGVEINELNRNISLLQMLREELNPRLCGYFQTWMCTLCSAYERDQVGRVRAYFLCQRQRDSRAESLDQCQHVSAVYHAISCAAQLCGSCYDPS